MLNENEINDMIDDELETLRKKVLELEVQLDAAVRLKNECLESRDYYKKKVSEYVSGLKRDKEIQNLERDVEYWKQQNYREFNMLKGTVKNED